jgi:hypothetical protein
MEELTKVMQDLEEAAMLEQQAQEAILEAHRARSEANKALWHSARKAVDIARRKAQGRR